MPYPFGAGSRIYRYRETNSLWNCAIFAVCCCCHFIFGCIFVVAHSIFNVPFCIERAFGAGRLARMERVSSLLNVSNAQLGFPFDWHLAASILRFQHFAIVWICLASRLNDESIARKHKVNATQFVEIIPWRHNHTLMSMLSNSFTRSNANRLGCHYRMLTQNHRCKANVMAFRFADAISNQNASIWFASRRVYLQNEHRSLCHCMITKCILFTFGEMLWKTLKTSSSVFTRLRQFANNKCDYGVFCARPKCNCTYFQLSNQLSWMQSHYMHVHLKTDVSRENVWFRCKILSWKFVDRQHFWRLRWLKLMSITFVDILH